MTDIKVINVGDLFKTKETWTVQETTIGRMTYIPFKEVRYGLVEKPEYPIDVYVKIDGMYVGQMTITKYNPLYDELVTKAEMPVFDDSCIEIPDDTYWIIRTKGNRHSRKYWYKDGKFFEFDRCRCFEYDDGTTGFNSHTQFIKSIEDAIKQYLAFSDKYYENRNTVMLERIIPVINKSSKISKERNKIVSNEILENIIPYKNNNLIGVKAKEIVNNGRWPFATFEVFMRNDENESWKDTKVARVVNDLDGFCTRTLGRDDIITDGKLTGLNISVTDVIHVEMSDGTIDSIPISFNEGELLRYDPEISDFRPFNETDYSKYENAEIYRNIFKKYNGFEGGDE